MSDNAEKIAKLRAEADALEAADKAFAELADDHRLAITLHKIFCTHNHTDACSWYYEGSESNPNWGGYAHSEYLGKAQKVLHFCDNHGIDTDKAIDLVKIVRGY